MTLYDEEDLAPLSALQHLAFCPRQCGLIHLEQAWSENRSTAEGRLFHERTHEAGREWREGVLVTRGLRLASRRLGLAGMADVVEFHPAQNGCRLPGLDGTWQPYPVEYKQGRPKKHNADTIQLCAQALCLEEMLDVAVPSGALFYGRTRRRSDCLFAEPLREETLNMVHRLHALLQSCSVPPPEPGPKCELCSLREQCLPDLHRDAKAFVATAVEEALKEPDA